MLSQLWRSTHRDGIDNGLHCGPLLQSLVHERSDPRGHQYARARCPRDQTRVTAANCVTLSAELCRTCIVHSQDQTPDSRPDSCGAGVWSIKCPGGYLEDSVLNE